MHLLWCWLSRCPGSSRCTMKVKSDTEARLQVWIARIPRQRLSDHECAESGFLAMAIIWRVSFGLSAGWVQPWIGR